MVANRSISLHDAKSVLDGDRSSYDEDTGHDVLAPVLRKAQAHPRPIERVNVTTGRARLIALLRGAGDIDGDDDQSGSPLPNPALIRTPQAGVPTQKAASELPQYLIDEMLLDEFHFVNFPDANPDAQAKPKPLMLREEDKIVAPVEVTPKRIRPRRPKLPAARRREPKPATFVKLDGKIWAID